MSKNINKSDEESLWVNIPEKTVGQKYYGAFSNTAAKPLENKNPTNNINYSNPNVKNVYASTHNNSNQNVKNVYASTHNNSNQNVKNVYASTHNNSNQNVKNSYATGPIYKSISGNKVTATDYGTNCEPKLVSIKSVKSVKKDIYNEKLNSINRVLYEACLPEQSLSKMIVEFKNKKQINKKTGSLVAHLSPLLINYYDTYGNNRYSSITSQNFQDQVESYYKKYNCSVSFTNDGDNEVYKIYLYPQ